MQFHVYTTLGTVHIRAWVLPWERAIRCALETIYSWMSCLRLSIPERRQFIDFTAATRNDDWQAESHLLVQDGLALARLACAQSCFRPQAGVSLSHMVLGSTLCLPRKSRA